MPIAKQLLNAFTAPEVSKITGISMPMINYLLREGYLRPAYGIRAADRDRGKVRYYSYRDLVVARIVQRLRDAGVELTKLKTAIRSLSALEDWPPRLEDDAGITLLRLIVTDGRKVLLKSADGFLEELNGQRSFAFVVDIESVQDEVMERIPKRKRKYFSMKNEERIPDRKRKIAGVREGDVLSGR